MTNAPPLRVLIVLTSLGSGGTERSLADLLPRYRAAGLTVELAVFGEVEEGVQAEVTRGGFVVHRVPGRSLATRARGLRRLIRARGPDLVHTSLFDADVAGRVAALGLAPVLTSIVNTSYSAARFGDPRIRPWKLRAAQALDAATGLLLTKHFHAVTETVAREATRTLGIPASRITVVERGRDPARLGEPGPARRAATRSALALRDDQPVLLNVGREEFQKGQSTLLAAAAALRRQHPDLVVLIAGRRGNVTGELDEQLARLGLEGAVRRLGHRDDVPDLLCAADLFV
ncbi:MAG: glycosyltransferase, partial [Deltaproteobacteria bacterium]|nr:glycosyltransferase [Deltaproteobacteria bacterium]